MPLGYGIMGIYALRSRAWSEMRLPNMMAMVFNGLSFIATLIALSRSELNGLVVIFGATSLGVTIASYLAIQRHGK